MIDKPKTKKDEELTAEEKDERLEEELEDSFPASDPPSQTQPNVAEGEPIRDEDKKKK